jgi:LAO/AO transport system kinase
MNAFSDDLLELCRRGDRRALAQGITRLETPGSPEYAALVDALGALDFPARVIGLTGPPGAGKSTLINELAVALLAEMRAQSKPAALAILAVDPSSPFTGGALLGDRVRMASLRHEPGVFIRSLGSREASGGLALAVGGALPLLALAGFDTVLLETVGAGQSEVEVAHFASTVCVLHAPGLGDDVQWMKAGILEAADVLVVTKGDRPEAADLKVQLELAVAENKDARGRVLKLLRQAGLAAPTAENWTPPVVQVSALKREGLGELLKCVAAHAAYLARANLLEPLRVARVGHELALHARVELQRRLTEKLAGSALPRAVLDGTLKFNAAVENLLRS